MKDLYLKFILVLIGFTSSTLSFSQNQSTDSSSFLVIQKNIDESTSGVIDFNLKYKTYIIESHPDNAFEWDINMYFTKIDSSKINFYLNVTKDSSNYEYAYFGDTILLLNKSKNIYQKKYTTEIMDGYVPFIINVLKTDYADFLTYDSVMLRDTTFVHNKRQGIIGEATTKENSIIQNLNLEVIVNQTIKTVISNKQLISFFKETILHQGESFFYKDILNYAINTFSTHKDKKQYNDIEKFIENQYNKLDNTITPNIKLEPEEEPIKSEPIKVEVPEHAHDWKLPLINGDTLNSKNINAKILVLDFYYMSCAPCIMAINDLVRLDSLYNNNDVQFIGANVYDKDTDKIKAFIKDKRIEYPNVINANILANRYGFIGYPQLLFINTKTNKIFHYSDGYTLNGYEHYKTIIDKELNVN